jgi:predicted ArsR family transcriptional regulator
LANKTKPAERQQRETEQRLAVLDAILKRHALSLQSIAQRTDFRLYLVRRHVDWLANNGYLVKRDNGRISMVTQRGHDALDAGRFTPNGKEPTR